MNNMIDRRFTAGGAFSKYSQAEINLLMPRIRFDGSVSDGERIHQPRQIAHFIEDFLSGSQEVPLVFCHLLTCALVKRQLSKVESMLGRDSFDNATKYTQSEECKTLDKLIRHE